MKLPLLWLHDYCDPGLGAQELASVLALSGTEVDRVHTHGVTALEQAEAFEALGQGEPAPRLEAQRAVAAVTAGGKVEVGLVTDGPAVTAPAIRF